MGYGIPLKWLMQLVLCIFVGCLPVKRITVSENFSKGTETQVMDFATTNGQGRSFSLQTGSSYVGNTVAVPSAYQPAYIFFRSRYTGNLRQGAASDDAIIAISRTLLLESKIFLVTSSMSTQPHKRYILSYDTAAESYTQVSRTTTNSGLRGFTGLSSDPAINNYAFWLHSTKNLYTWTQANGFGVFCLTAHSSSPYLQPYNSTILVYGSSATTIQFVSAATITMANSLTGAFVAHYFQVDRIDPNSLHLLQNISPFTLAAVDISGLGTYSSKVSRLLTAASRSHLLLFGVFPYVGFTTTDNILTLVHKATLLTVNPDVFPEQLPFVGLIGNAMDQLGASTFRFPVHYLVRASNCVNMHMFYFYFDFCDRTASGECQSCSEGYYKLPTGDDCFPISTGAQGEQVSSCSVPNCKECLASSDQCTLCSSTPSKLYLLNNLCVPSIVPGYGPSGASLVACESSHCVDCSSSFNKCLECDTPAGWFAVGGNCKSAAEIQSLKMGVDVITGNLQSCLVPQCLSCVADHTKCTACDPTNGFVLSSSGQSCTDRFVGTQKSRILLSYDSTRQTILMEFPGPIDTNISDSHFIIRLKDAAEFRNGLNCSEIESEVNVRIGKVNPGSILFEIKTHKQIIDGNLTFEASPEHKIKTAAGMILLGLPVSQAGIRITSVRQSPFIDVAAVSGEILSWGKIPLAILGAITKSRSPASPNYVFSQQSILALLEGPWVELPDQILYNSIQYIQGVPPLPNVFKAIGSDEEVCHLPVRYERIEMECSYLLNFGAPLLSICIFLVMSILVELIHGRLKVSISRTRSLVNQATTTLTDEKSKVVPNSITESNVSLTASGRFYSRRSSQLVWWAKNLDGLRLHFTIEYVEALMAEMLLYSLLNMTRQPSLTTLQVGGVLSVLSLVYHVAISFLCLSGAIKIISEHATETLPSMQPLSRSVDFENTTYPSLMKRYEDFCGPFNLVRAMQPLADYLRSLIFAFVVIGLQPYPALQIGIMIGIQALFMLNFWVFYSLKSPGQKRLTLWVELQFLAYMVLKMVVLYDENNERIQNTYGMAMAIILISLQVTSVLVECSNLIGIAYEMVRSRAQKSLKNFNTSSSVVIESERAKVVQSVTELVGSRILPADVSEPDQSRKANRVRILREPEIVKESDRGDEQFLVQQIGDEEVGNIANNEESQATAKKLDWLSPQLNTNPTVVTPVTTEDPQLKDLPKPVQALSNPVTFLEANEAMMMQNTELFVMASAPFSKEKL